MKRTMVAVVALAVMLLPTLARAQKVDTDFDPAVDFSAFKTYAWTTGTPSPNPIGEQRIQDAVNKALQAKGLKLVTANPDLVVATHAVGKEEKELYTTGYGGPYRWGGGMGTTTVNTYIKGTLAIDLYSAQTKKLAWRGVATDTMSDKAEKNAEKVNKAVEKLFKAYPPKPKK
jgi:hypothetical protein